MTAIRIILSKIISLLIFISIVNFSVAQPHIKNKSILVNVGYANYNNSWDMLELGLRGEFRIQSSPWGIYTALGFSNGGKSPYTDYYEETGIIPGYVDPEDDIPYPYIGWQPGLQGVEDYDYIALPTITTTVNIFNANIGAYYNLPINDNWSLQPRLGFSFVYINTSEFAYAFDAELQFWYEESGLFGDALVLVPYKHRRWSIGPELGCDIRRQLSPKAFLNLSLSYFNDLILNNIQRYSLAYQRIF